MAKKKDRPFRLGRDKKRCQLCLEAWVPEHACEIEEKYCRSCDKQIENFAYNGRAVLRKLIGRLETLEKARGE